LLTALTSADTSERAQFARKVIARQGIDPTTERGRNELRTYLLEREEAIGQAPRRARLLDSNGDPVDQMTLFRDRGLAPDTSIAIQFGVEQALAAIKARGLLQPGTVRRVAIVGPGLDVIDKQEGYDFYPPQTIQPFAVIDALIRLGLADAADLQLTAFDLSPGILQHLDSARERARAGRPYAMVLVRNLERAWTPELEQYWARLGDRIGEPAAAAVPPANTGRVDVRAIAIRPSTALSIVPRDLNIVLQRLEPASAGDRFDIVLATNILIYYDVFEQSLALTNIARMLRPGGLFLSNDRIVELPDSPLTSVGSTTTTYLKTPGIGDSGDRIEWFRRR
jgi:SAM-dependent methyltransferase